MLVLTRKEDESIIIDERIIITMGKIKGSRVKVKIDCPAEIKIRRSELPVKDSD